MKTRFGVGFYPRGGLPAARELLRKLGREDLAAQESKSGYYFTFASEPDFVAFRAEAHALGFTEENLSVRKEYIYTRPEIVGAPLLNLIVRTAEKGFGGPTYGTQFDLSRSCPRCGSGATQISPLVLKRSELPKNRPIFQTLDHDFLVSPELASALAQESVSGLELRQAVAHTDREALPWYQIISTVELPPMSELTRGIIQSKRDAPCPVCERDGRYHSGEQPPEIVYDAQAVNPEGLPDITHTYERFGKGGLREPFSDSHIANPLLMVTPKVFLIFQKLKVRRVEFVPVRIIRRPTDP